MCLNQRCTTVVDSDMFFCVSIRLLSLEWGNSCAVFVCCVYADERRRPQRLRPSCNIVAPACMWIVNIPTLVDVADIFSSRFVCLSCHTYSAPRCKMWTYGQSGKWQPDFMGDATEHHMPLVSCRHVAKQAYASNIRERSDVVVDDVALR